MPGAPRDLLSEDDLARLEGAVRHILTRVGVLIQSERLLRALQAHGARVDGATQRALIPEALLEAVIAERKGQAARHPAEPPRAVSGDYRIGVESHVAQFYLDPGTGERRAAGRDDFLTLVHFGDAWDESLAVDHVLLLREEPPLIEPLEALALLLEHARRPGDVYAHYAEQFPYLAEIGEIVAGDRTRFLRGGIFMVSPLRMDKRAADFMAARSDLGLSSGVGTQPVAGASAPVTAAGAIAQGAAEILAGWCAQYALNPTLDLAGSICSGALDMAAGNVAFCSPETMLQDVGCVEFFRRRCGGGVGVAGGSDYTSAKVPGLQAAFEKTVEAMGIAMYTGRPMRMGSGLLESGKTFSPQQFILDQELGSFLWAMERGVEVSEDTLALEAVASVGSGIGASHLETEHTLRHFRDLWQPRLLDRAVRKDDAWEAQADRRLLERATRRFHDVLAQYRPPEVDREMLRRVRTVVDRARNELL